MRLLKSRTFWLVVVAIISVLQWFRSEMSAVNATKPTAWTVHHKGDCAVVLTGGPGRVREGFDLLAQGRIRKLIISGVNPGSELREIFPEWPYYGPLNPEDVILEKRSGSTYGNAVQTLPLVEALNCHEVVLITSRLHMYRSARIFSKVYPGEIKIQDRAIVAGALKDSLLDKSLEAIKSMFYSLWAY